MPRSGKVLILPVADGRVTVVSNSGLEEALRLQVVHQVVGVVRRAVAGRALAGPEEHLLPAHLGFARLLRVEHAQHAELRGRGEVEDFHELGHEVDLAAALQNGFTPFFAAITWSPSK